MLPYEGQTRSESVLFESFQNLQSVTIDGLYTEEHGDNLRQLLMSVKTLINLHLIWSHFRDHLLLLNGIDLSSLRSKLTHLRLENFFIGSSDYLWLCEHLAPTL